MEETTIDELRSQATKYRTIRLKERLARMSEEELKAYRKKRAEYQRNYRERKKKKLQDKEEK